MKVAIYIRVSTEDQAKDGYSLEVQREYLESFAERESIDIFKIYQDDGISGYSTERLALKQLLKNAKQKKFELVLVYKIDRFSKKSKCSQRFAEDPHSHLRLSDGCVICGLWKGLQRR